MEAFGGFVMAACSGGLLTGADITPPAAAPLQPVGCFHDHITPLANGTDMHRSLNLACRTYDIMIPNVLSWSVVYGRVVTYNYMSN
jgi:hypothetical protein